MAIGLPRKDLRDFACQAAAAGAHRVGSVAKAPDPNRADFQVRRPDTLQFGSLEGLERMAGVSRHRLRRLIVKEATDNALDECDRVGRPGQVSIRREGDRITVTDAGRGITGDAAALADLFSSGRAMLSAKFLRLPERGALGNGLRVLVAAVAMCHGTIIVEALGRRTVLRPRGWARRKSWRRRAHHDCRDQARIHPLRPSHSPGRA